MQAGAVKNLRKFMFWQMAVFNKMLKDCRGGIGTAVLAGILCAAVCLHAAVTPWELVLPDGVEVTRKGAWRPR